MTINLAEMADLKLLAHWDELGLDIKAEALARVIAERLNGQYPNIRTISGNYHEGTWLPIASNYRFYGTFNGGNIPKFAYSDEDPERRLMAQGMQESPRNFLNWLLNRTQQSSRIQYEFGDPLALNHHSKVFIPEKHVDVLEICKEIKERHRLKIDLKVVNFNKVFGNIKHYVQEYYD